MVGADRIAMAVGRLLGKAALGLVGLVIVLGPFVPPPEPAAPVRSDLGDPPRSPVTVTLRIPEGGIAGHVIVVDESGRELATISRWFNGDMFVQARRAAGTGINFYLNNLTGETCGRVFGAARDTHIDAAPDGTAKVRACGFRSGSDESVNPAPTETGSPGCFDPSPPGAISDIRR